MNVYLPKETIPQKLDRNVLNDCRNTIKEKVEDLFNKNTNSFILQDGPPYSNGELHLGHLLNKCLKDFYIKYKLQQGFKVDVRFGWDCHGLPIENRAKGMEGDLKDNCKSIALKYRDIQKNTLNHFGIFSTNKDYLTMDEDFVQRELEIFNNLKENGYIFEKEKPTWYSPKLQTVLANSEIEYKNVKDNSVYFFLSIDNPNPLKADNKFLVWTTTEWTILGNQAVCLNPEIEYVKTLFGEICSKRFALEQGYKFFENISVEKIKSFKTYKNLKSEECPILFDEFVKDENTGIVHLCGGHGEEDFNVLTKYNIVPKNVVENLKDLESHINNYKIPSEFLLERKEIEHSYPIDWRLKEKVVKVLTLQTYLNFDWDKIKQVSKQIKMSTKDRDRLNSMLFSRKDWCLSRQRKWGVEIPNSKDILDVWFDSGCVFSMYDNPADIYIEGSDQHRGWFQSSIIISSMLNKTPTKKILTHGFVVDANGEKLAKSSQNYEKLEDLFDKYNPDVLRLWVLLSDYKNDVVFSEDSLNSAAKQYFKIRNFLRYLVNNLHRDNHSKNLNSLLNTKLEKLKKTISEQVELSEIGKALRNVMQFCSDYSATLSEDIKNKFYESDLNSDFRIEMENEFYSLAKELLEILFPFVPFLSIEIGKSL